jgi:hypothetical protein
MEDKLFSFGAGIGIGILSLWAIIELAPLLLVGGVGYLMVTKSSSQLKEEKENGR